MPRSTCAPPPSPCCRHIEPAARAGGVAARRHKKAQGRSRVQIPEGRILAVPPKLAAGMPPEPAGKMPAPRIARFQRAGSGNIPAPCRMMVQARCAHPRAPPVFSGARLCLKDQAQRSAMIKVRDAPGALHSRAPLDCDLAFLRCLRLFAAIPSPPSDLNPCHPRHPWSNKFQEL
jgi:hypothetical protein